jgi:hypothetical protein
MAGERGFAHASERRDRDDARMREGGQAIEKEFLVEFDEGLVAAYEVVDRAVFQERRAAYVSSHWAGFLHVVANAVEELLPMRVCGCFYIEMIALKES